MKKVLCVISIVLCLSIMVLIVSAAVIPISPLWNDNITSSLYLSFSETTGVVQLTVRGYDAESISANMNLYYKGIFGIWIPIDTDWDYSVNSGYLSVTETFDAVSGREYKVEMSGQVFSNGTSDSISGVKTKICS